jgi:hypothetical protein
MDEYGTGAPDEIREVGSDRLLYRDGKRGWERIATDVPPVEEIAVS